MKSKKTCTYQILGQARVGPAKGRTRSALLSLYLDRQYKPELVFLSYGRPPFLKKPKEAEPKKAT